MSVESLHVAGIVPLLLRRKILLLASGAITAAVAFAVGQSLPRSYIGEGAVIIDSNGSATPVSMLTQVDVLQSPTLIQRVVANLDPGQRDRLIPSFRLSSQALRPLTAIYGELTVVWHNMIGISGKTLDPITKLTDYARSHLTVVQGKGGKSESSAVDADKSSVIFVRFQAGDPVVAATVTNAVIATYLADSSTAQQARIGLVDGFIARQMAAHRKEVEAAEHRLTEYVQQHDVAEVQGSQTAAIQYGNDQAQLALARADLARREAALETAKTGGSVTGAEETLGSKTIQSLKENEAKILALVNLLSPNDPRREQRILELNSYRAQISAESALIVASLTRAVHVAQANVHALEKLTAKEAVSAQSASVVATTLKQLTNDLDLKRQEYIARTTSGIAQMRVAVEQAPTPRILTLATPPERPVHTFGLASIVLGFCLGSVGAGGIVLFRNLVSNSIRSSADLALITGLPVLGSLPVIKHARGGHIKASEQTIAMMTETFRAMWLALRPRQQDGTIILLTSSEVGEGKTTVAMMLARRFATDGARVLLIDADLRRPRLATSLNVRPTAYLESALDGEPIERAVTSLSSGLDCIFADGTARNPVKALTSIFEQLLADSKRQYDFVILDSSPLLHVVDPVLLANICDRVIMVVQAGRLSGDLVLEAANRFAESDRAKIFGLLTRVRSGDLDQRDYYAGYAARRIADH